MYSRTHFSQSRWFLCNQRTVHLVNNWLTVFCMYWDILCVVYINTKCLCDSTDLDLKHAFNAHDSGFQYLTTKNINEIANTEANNELNYNCNWKMINDTDPVSSHLFFCTFKKLVKLLLKGKNVILKCSKLENWFKLKS